MKRICLFLIFIYALLLCGCSDKGGSDASKNSVMQKADSLLEASFDTFDKGNFSDAQSMGERALAIYTEAKDTANMRECYSQLCCCYARTSNTERAIAMGEKALKIDSIKMDYESMGSDYNNLAAVYLAVKDVENAKKFIDENGSYIEHQQE